MSNAINQIEALAKQIDEDIRMAFAKAAGELGDRVALIAAIASCSRVAAGALAELEEFYSEDRDILRNIGEEIARHNAEAGRREVVELDSAPYVPPDGVTAGAAVAWERSAELDGWLMEISGVYDGAFSILYGQSGFDVFAPDPAIICEALVAAGHDVSLREVVDEHGSEVLAVFVPYGGVGGGDD